MTFKVIKYKRAVLILLIIVDVTQRNAIGNVLGVLKHTRVETATEIMIGCEYMTVFEKNSGLYGI